LTFKLNYSTPVRCCNANKKNEEIAVIEHLTSLDFEVSPQQCVGYNNYHYRRDPEFAGDFHCRPPEGSEITETDRKLFIALLERFYKKYG